MPSPKRITVVIADQHPAVRAGIKSALGPAFQVVASVDNGREAVRQAHKLKPAVVIMDVPMPRLNGLEAAYQIHTENPQTRVLLFSSVHEPYHIEQAMRARVSGYLLKSSAVEVLPKAARAIHAGQKFFSPSIEAHLKAHAKRPGYATTEPSGLTSQEIELLQLCAEGFQNKEIAAELGINVKRADNIRQSLMKKLNIHDIASLTNFAIRGGRSQGK